MGIAVGIDLGTTNSCVAVVQAQRARVVEDAAGKRIQPSVISFHPDGRVLAGHDAKERMIIDPHNTIYSFKRLLGRELESPEMQAFVRECPYTVVKGPEGIPAVQARGREVSLPEVSAMMLKHMRDVCEETLGVEISEAVITVPANFNDVQRSSTKIAGRIAGFNVLRILNEPTAAALAYGFGGKKSERIAIYDFGGGTFDITVIELMDDIFEVLSTAGDTFLGGDDLDNKIIEEMRAAFLKQHKYDLAADPMAMQRIRSVAERMKCQLSSLDEVEATLREIAYGPGGAAIDFTFRMTRARFEELVEPLVERSLKTCDEALKLARMAPGALDNLILVGGTTRVPLVRRKVREYFAREPRTEINPDEVVAIGAAIHAFSLTGEELPENLPRREPKAPPRPMINTMGLMESVRTSRLPQGASPQPLFGLDEPDPDLPGLPDLDGDLPGLPEPDPDLPGPARRFDGSRPVPIGAFGDGRPQNKTMIGIKAPPRPAPPPTRPEEPPELDADDVLELVPDSVPPGPAAVASDAPIAMPLPAQPAQPFFAAPPQAGRADFDWAEEDEEPAPSASGKFGEIGFGSLPPPPPEAAPEAPARSEPERVAPRDLVAGEERVKPKGARESFSVPMVSGAVSTLLLDVTPRGLGVATAGGYCDTIIERNAAIPIEQSRLFSTSRDGQTEVLIDVYQGESRRVEQNARLGQVQLSGLRPTARGEIKIRVTFEIDTDGILGVSAINEESQEVARTRIVLTGGLDEDQVNALVRKYSK